ncbi:hypothetical protein OS493_032943 [Desmophyllum pertusum]|uniref:USP domain-containing protein n=1 Tax=Desmophyllum pertusum TaxID=174260 RepID=A0A9W9Y862_9CNID|nr:hypothetical protein OS493_032943 [Desmophyllum pertusum]
MDALLESIVLREQGKFHSSKIVLWNYLRNHTSHGQTTFPIGQMAAISNIFDALCNNMTEEEKKIISIRESVNVKCSDNCHHSNTRDNTYSTYFLHNTCINITEIANSSYDPISVAQKLFTQPDTAWHVRRSVCLQKNKDGSNCGGKLVTSCLINDPFLFAIELDKDEGRSVQPALHERLQINLGKTRYDLAAVIYHHNFHFWCEVFVSHKNYKGGWYLYNDMWNGGKAEYIGKHPQVKNPSYMYILLFEKNQVNITTSGLKDNSSSIKNIISLGHQKNVIPDIKQVKENYASILKFCAISVHTTMSCKAMRAQILENEQEILTSLNTKCMEQNNGAVKRNNGDQQSDSSPPKIMKRV